MKTLIRNGIILDGSTQPEKTGDILIENEKIKAISKDVAIKEDVDRVIDAEGSFIAPGFVDINNESDHYLTLFTAPEQESLIAQGVTTIIVGNNGSSLAPVFRDNLKSIRKWGRVNINVDWQTVSDFLKYLKKMKLRLNVYTLVGHSTMRRGIIGEEQRDLTDKELEQLIGLTEECIEGGAKGISFGLKYNHSNQTPFNELLELTRLAKKLDVPVVFQPRNEKENILSFIEEIVALVETLGSNNCPRIEITHLHAHKNILDEVCQTVAIINDLKNKGVDINFDVAPFTQVSNPLYLYFPPWFCYGNFETMINSLNNSFVRKRLLTDLKNSHYDFSNMIVSRAQEQLSCLNGKSIAYLAEKRSLSGEEMMVELFKMNAGQIMIICNELSWPETLGLLEHPLSIIATQNPGLNYSGFNFLPHPASFNTFPRFLSLVKEKEVELSWPEAIRKISAEPAAKMGLKKRGLIAPDYFADLTIFNPEKFNAKIDIKNPIQRICGIDYVFINGELVLENGVSKKHSDGRMLKKKNEKNQ